MQTFVIAIFYSFAILVRSSCRAFTSFFTHALCQCFSTFLLQRNLPQMFALLMEPYAMVQVYITIYELFS